MLSHQSNEHMGTAAEIPQGSLILLGAEANFTALAVLCCHFVWLTFIWEIGKSRVLDSANPGPEVIKPFFMLSSAEHEICSANKSQLINNCKFYLAIRSWKFVGTFIFINHAQLSWAWKKFYNLEARLRRLIWIFAGCICPKVRFLTLGLIW